MPIAGQVRELKKAAQTTIAQFKVLETSLDERGWCVFAALAAEAQLGSSTLEQFGASASQLQTWSAAGWLERVSDMRPRSIVKNGHSEAAYAVAAKFRQLVLRAAHKRGVLGTVTLKLEGLFGARSTSALARKLQTGTLIFRPFEQHLVAAEVSGALRASLLEPFDPQWMVEVWGKRTASVVHHGR